MKPLSKTLTPLKLSLALAVHLGLFAPSLVLANGANGEMVFNLDQNALATLLGGKNQPGSRYMYVEDVFDETYNNVLIKGDNPNPTPGIDPIPSDNIRFKVNGATITPAPEASGRYLQVTNFNYTDDPTKGTGEIAFSGAIRYHSDVWPGTLLMREMTLSYDPTRINKEKKGESGWIIQAHEPIFGTTTVFDLTDVTTATVNGALKLSGSLFITDTWAALLMIEPGIKVGEVNLIPAGEDHSGHDHDHMGNATMPAYDDNTKMVTIPDVQAGNQHYHVTMALQSNGLFNLKTADVLKSSTATAPAVYNLTDNRLTIPKVKAFGKTYKVVLTNTGNFVFRLDEAIDAP